MSSDLTTWQNELITTIAHSEGIKEFDIETAKGGDGSFGTITAVTVKGKKDVLEVIIKAATNDKNVRAVNPVRKAYLREIYIYEEVLPVFREFEDKTGATRLFNGYPRLYGSKSDENKECVVVENLSKEGFKLWNRKVPMNAEHVEVVIAEYAKLHAISLAMNHKNPSFFKDITKDLTNVFESHSMAMVKMALDIGRNAVEDYPKATEAVNELEKSLDFFLNTQLEDSEIKMVVIHNDGWCNNVMFKYENKDGPNTPTKANIIDWQLAMLGCPVLDLSCFLLTCASPQIIKDYITYLRKYHEALKDHLNEMSCDVELLYPFTKLSDHWQKYSKFGLYTAIIMLKFMLSEENELPNISQMARTGMSFVDRLKFDTVNVEIYNKRVSEIIRIMVECSLI